MTAIIAIEGIGDKYAAVLKGIGIATVEALLKAGATPKGRQEIAEKTGISDKLVLEWTNRADLFRIKGVAEEYSDLLEASGVDTVVELAQRNAEHLFQKMVAINDETEKVRKLPTQGQVSDWIEQAKALPRILTY